MIKHENIIRINRIKLTNFKNVKNGEIFLNSKNADNSTVNILGMYGQNGSGKSAFVDAMKIISLLLQGNSLPQNTNDLIYFDEPKSTIEIDFIYYQKTLQHSYNMFYKVDLIKNNSYINATSNNNSPSILIANETLKYKQVGKGNWSSSIIIYDYENPDTVFIPTSTHSALTYNQENLLNVLLAKRISLNEARSFIFSQEMFKVYDSTLNHISQTMNITNLETARKIMLLSDLRYYSITSLNILTEQNVLLASQVPLVVDFNKKNLVKEQFRYFDMHFNKPLPKTLVDDLIKTYADINNVLTTIIPDLTISIKELSRLTDEKGNELVEIETYSNRRKISIPFKYESQGIRKIISLLGYLVQVYNNESACVVIDELDSAIFEYLLGELLIVFKENAKGQLIFTSHNLRALEVLDSNSVVFTTTNPENRYIKFKNVKKDNNLRDKYYATIQLGGQDEEVYLAQKTHVIRRAFRKAGDLNGEI